MKKKIFLLALLSSLSLAGCDALDAFFADSLPENSNVNENGESQKEGEEETNTSQEESQQGENSENQPSTEEENNPTQEEENPGQQEENPGQQEENPGQQEEQQPVTTPEVGNYYSSISSTATGSTLKSALCALTKKNHEKYSYDSLEIAMRTTDRNWEKSPDPNDENPYMNLLYLVDNENKPHLWNTSHGSYGTTVTGKIVWDKEHIWAKSNGFNTKSLPAYSDLHHLRASDMKNNNNRSNLAFSSCSSGSYVLDFNGDKSGKKGTVYEPIDRDKGDVARALFYMATRYMDGDGSGGTKLTLTTGTDSSGGKWGYLSTLIAWHEQDPPDAFEIKRNGLVQELQGNRNPYIDHPEWVKKVFGN